MWGSLLSKIKSLQKQSYIKLFWSPAVAVCRYYGIWGYGGQLACLKACVPIRLCGIYLIRAVPLNHNLSWWGDVTVRIVGNVCLSQGKWETTILRLLLRHTPLPQSLRCHRQSWTWLYIHGYNPDIAAACMIFAERASKCTRISMGKNSFGCVWHVC